MFCKPRTSLFPLSILLIILLVEVALASCSKPPASGVERLGVMAIENLTSDAQLNWPSRAAAAVVVYDLAGAKNIFARQVDSISAAQSMRASRVLEGYFFERNGRIGIHAALEDLGSAKTVESYEFDGTVSAGFLPLVNELARRLSPEVRTFGTQNEKAFQFYGEALAARDSQSAEQDLEAATHADPGFTAGYVDEAKLLAETGNRAQARQVVLAGSRARRDPIDGANLEYVGATASGDATDRVKALELLTAATPANANIFTELGEMRFARRQFKQAVMEYRAAVHLDPEALPVWNQLGYALAWSGDLNGARDALAQYQRLAPGNLNAIDSQGEVSYMLGDFKSASEDFEKASAKNPSELLKAAEARLMAGDLQGADGLFLKHLGPGAKVQNGAGYQMAQWEFMTGRRNAGMARMEKLAQGSSGDFQALALSQLSIWKLDGGDKKAAADLARQAAAAAQNPVARKMSAIAAAIAAGGATSSGSKVVDAYALLFAKKYREAVPLLQAAYAETNPSVDGEIRTLLAWAYVETGAIEQAASLVESTPFVLSFGEPQFTTPILARYLFVRSAVLEHQGKKNEARNSQELYSKYAGITK